MERITKRQLDDVIHIIHKHLPNAKLKAFIDIPGQMPSITPDLDLMIMGDEAPSEKVMEEMKDELRKTTFPFGIDICVWAKLTDDLKQILISQLNNI